MSTIIAKEQAAFAKEEAKFKKFLAAVKKLFAKEFLWVLVVLVVAVPITVLLKIWVETYTSKEALNAINQLFKDELFLGLYIITIAGIYIIRTITGSIKLLSKTITK